MDQNAPSVINSNPNSISKSIPCASCKYQRRRCPPTCLLAPYFPATNNHEFQNARRLFGVCNFSKFLKRVKPPLRDDVAKCLIFEANVRAADPVGGCYRIILELERQIRQVTAEINFLRLNLEHYRRSGVPMRDEFLSPENHVGFLPENQGFSGFDMQGI